MWPEHLPDHASWVSVDRPYAPLQLSMGVDFQRGETTVHGYDWGDGEYIQAELPRQLLAEKARFDKVYEESPSRFREARGRSNPYEGIPTAPFKSPAGLKFAEIDMLTKITDPLKQRLSLDESAVVRVAVFGASPWGEYTAY
ncbi:hypothetical protein KIPB_012035, partial [Kipferlia bialata]|eukprot:g12035.t1